MITDLLERLKSDEFAFTVGFLVPSLALRGKLGAMKEVENVVAAIAGGELSEDTLRHFVSTLMKELRKGERFPYDLALAALAVALEGRATKFAQEYLQD